jgi:hypothetical protein
MVNTTAASNLFVTRVAVQNIDTSSIEKAKNLFDVYKKEGVILAPTFDSMEWPCTDEYENLTIRFNVDTFLYKRFYRDMLGLDYNMFRDYVKTYVMFCMGDIALSSLNNVVRDIKHLIKTDYKELYASSDTISLKLPNKIIEFFTILPEAENEEDFDYLMGVLDNIQDVVRANTSDSSARNLASFDSYFLFNDILNDYWKSDIDRDERLFFYPIYLWWKITGVIPLRPREFILTPRDCLEKKSDGYYLTLRRNHIKGTDKKKNYKISMDYYNVQYKIPDTLAQDILDYLKYTKEYDSTQLETLFITDTHYRQWNQKKRCTSRFFTYANMNCVMRYFYKDVIMDKYHLTIQSDRTLKHLDKGEIHYIYLGDTRHLALINIIAEGGTPVLAMMLAGHDDMDMASHYYSNITSLIECRTYSQYRKVLRGEVMYELSNTEKLPSSAVSYISLADGNRCYSDNYINRDYSDCEKVIGPKGEMGYCPDCKHYRKVSDENFFSNDVTYKRKISEDCKYLEDMVHAVRNMDAQKEDIMKAFLRLKSSSFDYEQFLKEKALRGD